MLVNPFSPPHPTPPCHSAAPLSSLYLKHSLPLAARDQEKITLKHSHDLHCAYSRVSRVCGIATASSRTSRGRSMAVSEISQPRGPCSSLCARVPSSRQLALRFVHLASPSFFFFFFFFFFVAMRIVLISDFSPFSFFLVARVLYLSMTRDLFFNGFRYSWCFGPFISKVV